MVATVIISLLLAVAFFFAIRKCVRDAKSGNGCAGCSGCAKGMSCSAQSCISNLKEAFGEDEIHG